MFQRQLLPILGLAFFFLHAPAKLYAALYADVETSMGTFTMDLDYANTPRTVGNFIGLATGELSWIDPDTGRVRENTPYFEGIIFHRVISGFMNQTGDPTGTGRGGPGYRFTDELSTSDFSVPYRVAMANSGPQTNGSQFFVTAPASSLPDHLDGIHTVFGHIPEDDGAGGIVDGSRSVVDAINAVPTTNNLPDTPVEILSVTIRRTDPSAEAFEIPVADLPRIAPVEVDFMPDDNGMELAFNQPPGTTFRTGVSGDLFIWDLASRYVSSDEPASASYAPILSGTDASAQFYTPALVTPANTVTFPNSLANRSLTAEAGSLGTIELNFDEGASSGTYEVRDPDGLNPIAGTIADAFFEADANGCRLVLLLNGITPSVWNFNRMGLDSWDTAQMNGRHGLILYETIEDYNAGNRRGAFPDIFTLSR